MNWYHTKEMNSLFPVADGTAKLSGGDRRSRKTHSKAGNIMQGATISVENFKVNRESLIWKNQQMTVKLVLADFWSMKGDFIYRHHNEPRVQPRADGRTIPCSTEIHWCNKTMQEKRVDDFGKADSNRCLSDSWNGLHKIHSRERKTSQGIHMCPGRRLTKVHTTTRRDHVWPEVWKNRKSFRIDKNRNGKHEKP